MDNRAITDEQIIAAEEASGHSVYGGSSLPRIVACPASVRAQLGAGLQPESIYAKKGTILHGWSEKAMKTTDPRKYLLSQPSIDIEDTSYLLDSVDYVKKIIDLHPDGSYTLRLEAKGNLASYGLPEVWGTMDVVIESPKRIDVIDYKYGHGVSVYAKKNYQLVSYLAMALPYEEVPEDKELFVHICQPPKKIFDSWKLDHATVAQMIIGDVTDAIAESRTASPRFGPSASACRFCTANMNCIPRHKYLRKQANVIQSMSKNPSAVSNEQWAIFLDGWDALKQAATQVQRHAESELMAGRDFPGYKLVGGKANRKFNDTKKGEEFIKKRLGKKAYKPAPLVTLAYAEKLDPTLKKDDEWNDLIYKPTGKPHLVKDDAPGKAIPYGVRSAFNAIAADMNKI